jgi:hypothetical protein
MHSENLTHDDQQIENDFHFIQDDEDKTSVTAFGKRTNTSEVWDYFDRIEWEDEKKMAKCKVAKCVHKAFSCGRAGTTRPLWRHLETSHRTVYMRTEEYQRKRKLMKKDCGNLEEMLQRVSFHFYYFRYVLLFRLIFPLNLPYR